MVSDFCQQLHSMIRERIRGFLSVMLLEASGRLGVSQVRLLRRIQRTKGLVVSIWCIQTWTR